MKYLINLLLSCILTLFMLQSLGTLTREPPTRETLEYQEGVLVSTGPCSQGRGPHHFTLELDDKIKRLKFSLSCGGNTEKSLRNSTGRSVRIGWRLEDTLLFFGREQEIWTVAIDQREIEPLEDRVARMKGLRWLDKALLVIYGSILLYLLTDTFVIPVWRKWHLAHAGDEPDNPLIIELYAPFSWFVTMVLANMAMIGLLGLLLVIAMLLLISKGHLFWNLLVLGGAVVCSLWLLRTFFRFLLGFGYSLKYRQLPVVVCDREGIGFRALDSAEYKAYEFRDIVQLNLASRIGQIQCHLQDGRCIGIPCEGLLGSHLSTVSSAKEFLGVIEKNVPGWKRQLSWQWQVLYKDSPKKAGA
jgi:hypothetical protein